MNTPNEFSNYEQRLARVYAHIEQNIAQELSLDALADIAAMSRYHWHRVFKAMTGETMAEAIRRIRLHKAANALIQDEAAIGDIAARVGYGNLASFSRAFSAAYGQSPQAFRDKGQRFVSAIKDLKGESKMFPISIKELPATKAAGVAHMGPYIEIGGAFQQLYGVLMARQLLPHTSGMFGAYYDVPGSKPDDELRAHAAVVMCDGFPSDIADLEYFDIADGKFAVMEHTGPYATLEAAYQWLYGTWLPGSGEEPRDAPPLEFYLNDPSTTAPQDLRTDIRLPLV